MNAENAIDSTLARAAARVLCACGHQQRMHAEGPCYAKSKDGDRLLCECPGFTAKERIS